MDNLLAVLKNWRTMNHHLTQLTEEEVVTLLDYEKNNQKRMSVLERLHQRFNMLRCTRERLEILAIVERV